MKQIIPFSKELLFDTKISEITSISLEHDLKLDHDDSVVGNFYVSGEYRVSDMSVNQNSFHFDIPFSITLNSHYDVHQIKIDIDDFYYEISHDDILKVYIDVMIDHATAPDFIKEIDVNGKNEGIEELMDDTLRHEQIEDLFQEFEEPPTPVFEFEKKQEKPVLDNSKLKSLFDSFANEEETYTTYHVHIVREEDTIEKIMLQYKVSKDDLALYNKIDTMVLGEKIIIPATNE